MGSLLWLRGDPDNMTKWSVLLEALEAQCPCSPTSIFVYCNINLHQNNLSVSLWLMISLYVPASSQKMSLDLCCLCFLKTSPCTATPPCCWARSHQLDKQTVLIHFVLVNHDEALTESLLHACTDAWSVLNWKAKQGTGVSNSEKLCRNIFTLDLPIRLLDQSCIMSRFSEKWEATQTDKEEEKTDKRRPEQRRGERHYFRTEKECARSLFCSLSSLCFCFTKNELHLKRLPASTRLSSILLS